MQSGSRYEITREPFDGLTSFVLREPATGSAARVVPDLGNNVVSFRTTVGATVRDILMPPPSLATLREQPLWYGVPVMFPFPGRVRGARFSFAGREVELVSSDGQGNALHGVAFHRAWTVVEATADDGAALCSRIDTDTHPDILREWPFPFRLTVGVRLRASALTLELAAENTGPGAMPMGLGLHPYFATPLGSGTRDEFLVSVSAERHWEQKMALPTGVVKPVAESIDPRRPRTIGSL
ncbi:MAG: aldose 1-epimerase, partial [Chloroflexi bacterium]|nr:aldose 1-epimerase [Chloroflexota bacterium]